jgi:hypothetical protein
MLILMDAIVCVCFWRYSPQWARASSFTRCLDHTQRRTTVGRTPLEEWSARRRDLYLTTHNTHKRQTSMLPVGFEPTISAGERPQSYALDRAATGTGCSSVCSVTLKSPVVTKGTIYCNTKTYAFSAEFNLEVRKILKHCNGIPISKNVPKFIDLWTKW